MEYTFFGAVIGLVLGAYTRALVIFILSKIFGLTILCVGIFTFEGIRYKNGDKFRWNKRKFALTPQVIPSGDKMTEKMDVFISVSSVGLSFLIYAVPLAIRYAGYKGDMLEGGKGFVTGLCLGGILHAVLLMIIVVILFSNTKNRRLERLQRERVAKLRAGMSFSQMEVYPQLAADTKVIKGSRIREWNFCVYRALITDDYNALPEYLKNMDDLLLVMNEYNEFIGFLGCYYNMLFYSSFIVPNPAHATRLYNVIRDRLEADTDVNGKRVLAAYQLMILNKPEQAAVTLYQAEEALKHVPEIYTEAEKELDIKYIKRIRERLAALSGPQNPAFGAMSYHEEI